VVARNDDYQFVRQPRPRLARDARDLDRDALEPAQAARRLGQLILPSPRFDLRRLLERRDTSDDFLQARLARSECVAVFQRETPWFFEKEGACNPRSSARALSLEGRWLETEAGIRTRGHVVALTVAAQRRFRTGLSLFSAASMRLSITRSIDLT